MAETITMKAETGYIDLSGAGAVIEQPLRVRLVALVEEMANLGVTFECVADRVLDLVGPAILAAIDRERERCAKLAEGDEHSMEHARKRIAGRIRGEIP